MEGVDVLEGRALGEQQQVGVAAGADGRVGAQRALEREVLAGGEELPFILRALLGVPALPRGVDLEEGELGERAVGHEDDPLKDGDGEKAASWRRREADYRRVPPGGWMVESRSCCSQPRSRSASRPRARPQPLARGRAPRPPSRCAFLPSGTSPARWRRVDGISPGLLSAGLGEGARRADLPRHRSGEPGLRLAVRRGAAAPVHARRQGPAGAVAGGASSAPDSAPADIVPGLLATSLERAGRSVRASADAGQAALVAADGEGRVPSAAPGANPAARSRAAGMTITSVEPGRLPSLVARPPGRGPADRDRAAAARGGWPSARDRDRGTRVRGPADLRQHAPRRPRAVHRPRADDPRAARTSRSPTRCRGSTIRADGAADPARLLSARGPHRGDRPSTRVR